MKKLKRVCVVLSASAMLLGTGIAFPNSALSSVTVTTVSAAEDTSNSVLTYSTDAASGTATVLRCTSVATDGTVVIPDTVTVDGVTYTVTAVGNQAFIGQPTLKSVELSSNVTSIGTAAFVSTGLTSINLSNVKSIGTSAFGGCSGLTSVDLSNVVSLDASAFGSCAALTSVDMPNVEKIGDAAFSGCTGLTSVSMPNVKTLGAQIFSGCNNLTSVDISNATSISEGAFSGCGDIVVYVAEGQDVSLTSNAAKKYVVDDSSVKLVWNDSTEDYDFAVVVDTDSYGGSQVAGAAYLDEVDALVNDTKTAQLEYYVDAENDKDIIFKVKINNKSDNSNEIRGQVQAVKDGKTVYYVTAPVTVVNGEAK